jgi:hypothetical protein
MATIKALFGTSNQAITCTFTSLASLGQRSSLAVDNSTNLFLDVLVSVKVKSNASGTSSTGSVNVYAAGTTDGGTTYGGGEASMGTDAGVTLSAPPNIVLIGVINVVANAVTYVKSGMSVAQAFSGSMPDHWCLVIENKSGAALDATVGSANYQGIQAQSV